MTEGTRTDIVWTHSLTGNLWWLLSPATALFYPVAVRGLHESGQRLRRDSGPGDAAAWMVLAISVALVYGAPDGGLSIALCADRSRLLSAALRKRICVLVDFLVGCPCHLRVEHAQAKNRNACFLYAELHPAESGARHF